MVIKNTLFVLTSVLLLEAGSSLAGNPGAVKWTLPFPTSGPVNGSPAVGPSGTIYVTSEDGYLYAINPATGQAAWPSPVFVNTAGPYPVALIASPVIAPDGTIYVVSSSDLYSVNPNGTLNWSLPVGGGEGGAIALASNGTIYVTFDDDPHLYAVNPAANGNQGGIQWTLDLYAHAGVSYVDSPPTVGPDGTIYLYAEGGGGNGLDEKLIAVEDENCSAGVKWAVELGFLEEDNDFHTTLVLDNAGRIYTPFGTNTTGLMAFNTADGSPAWYGPYTTPSGASIQTSPAIAADGTIYFGANDGLLYALNTNGTLKWKFDTQSGQPIQSSPTLASDGTIVFGVGDNRLWDIIDNGSIGTLEWTYPSLFSKPPLSGSIISSPLITGSDNAIYFGCADGNVYSVFGSAPLANSPWPMFRRDVAHTASAAPNTVPQQVWVGGVIGGLTNIYKGITGFGVPYSGYTWITLTRSSCTSTYNSSLHLTILLGGNGDVFSTPYSNYDPEWAYEQLDFTVTGANRAPFPHGYSVTFPPGQTQVTIGIQTVDNSDYSDVQSLLFIIPTGQPGFGVDPEASQATIWEHPDQNQ